MAGSSVFFVLSRFKVLVRGLWVSLHFFFLVSGRQLKFSSAFLSSSLDVSFGFVDTGPLARFQGVNGVRITLLFNLLALPLNASSVRESSLLIRPSHPLSIVIGTSQLSSLCPFSSHPVCLAPVSLFPWILFSSRWECTLKSTLPFDGSFFRLPF